MILVYLYYVLIAMMVYAFQMLISGHYLDKHKVKVKNTTINYIRFSFFPYAYLYVKELEKNRDNYLDMD